MYFYYFPIISPLRRAWPLKTNDPRMLRVKFGWSWTSCFWRRRFFKFFNVFLLFHNYLPFEKGVALHLTKLKAPSPKDALCQIWLKLAQWFWKLSIHFYYFLIICPFRRVGLFIWTNFNPLHHGIRCVKFDWNWSSDSGEEDKNVKSLQTDGQTVRRTDRQTYDGRQVIRKAHLLRWAKNGFNK